MKSDYQKNEHKGVLYFTAKRLAEFPFLLHGFSGKMEKAHFFFEALGMNQEKVLSLKQIHSDHIVSIKERPLCPDSFKKSEGDALITGISGLPLAVRTADCLSLILFHPEKRVIAVVHAGRKGTFLNIAGKVVEKMKGDYDISSDALIAALGPSIMSCCYEVGEDIASAVKGKYGEGKYIKETRDKKYFLDLTAMNIDQLLEGGVKRENIVSMGLCTCCHPELFYSYRRNSREKARMQNVVMLMPE